MNRVAHTYAVLRFKFLFENKIKKKLIYQQKRDSAGSGTMAFQRMLHQLLNYYYFMLEEIVQFYDTFCIRFGQVIELN